jgi:hypothetical protein
LPSQVKRSTKTHEADLVVFVEFRVISWIVLAQAAESTKQITTPSCNKAMKAELN